MANLVKTVELKILADDGDAEAKLDRITAKADKLREEHPEMTVRIDTAEATAKMAVFREELKAAARPIDEEIKLKVNKRSLAEAGTEIGGFAKLMGNIMGGGKGGGGLFGPLAEDGLGPLPAILTSPVGLGVLAAAASALATELVGVVAGFAAAGAGLGAFALLALPTFDKIKNAYTAITTAQSAYSTAVEKERVDPTAANAKSVASALVNLKVAEDNMSPSTRRAIHSIDELKSTYEKMSKAFQPIVMKVFNDGLKIANNLLPTLKGPATDFGNAIDGLLKQFGKFTQSKGFKDWLTQFDKLIGPATDAIGQGIGKVAVAVGKMFTAMSKKDVVHAVNIAFEILSDTIRGLTNSVTFVMRVWDDLDIAWKAVMKTARDVNRVIDTVRKTVVDFAIDASLAVIHAAGNIDHAFDNVEHAGDNFSHAISVTLKDVVGFFKTLGPRIMSAIGNLGSLLFRAGANAISGLLNGMRSMVGGAIQDAENWGHDIISAIGSPFGIHFSEPSQASKMITAGRNIAMGLGIGIRSGTPSVSSAAANLARSAGLSGSTAGGAGGGTRVVLELSGSDQQILTAFAHALRVRGGSPSLIGLKTS